MIGRNEREMKIYKSVEWKIKFLPDYVNSWYLNMRATDKTARTCQNYIQIVSEFLSFIACDGTTQQLTEANVNAYMISIKTKLVDGKIVETSDSKKNVTWYALNNFFTYLKATGVVEKNYMELIPRPKNRDLDRINANRELLTGDDFKAIIDAVDNEEDKWLKCRNKAILLLFMTTGMRKGALMSINKEDVDLDNRKLVVIDKGDKLHEYYLSDSVVYALEDWFEVRRDISDALFTTMYGERVGEWCVKRVVEKYTKIALGKPVSPHKLRAGFVSIMYDKTHDIEFVRRAVGHSNSSTTQRYIVTKNDERRISATVIDDLI